MIRRTMLTLAALALCSPLALAQEGAPATYANADELLTALETADEGVNTLRCNIVHTKLFGLAGDYQQRRGNLVYTTDPRQRFAISFEAMILDGRVYDSEKIYIFDGEWLVEKFPTDREFVKTRIVAPGEAFDPLRIGEGPFPVPIGQKREEILERFSAELRPADDGLEDEAFAAAARAAVGSRWIQLQLTPNDLFAEDTDLTDVRVWYDPTDLLPRMAKTVNEIGDESLVFLYSIEKNGQTSETEFSVATPGDDEGWNVTLRDRTGVAAQIEVTP